MAGTFATALGAACRQVLDFALPARCAGCGAIVDEPHNFCVDCWKQAEFLGEGGCRTCGMPLEHGVGGECAVCLASPPLIQRTRSALAYDELSRTVALKLKYGRKVALARTMARYMAPFVEKAGEPLLVPVPLHRTRLWNRGFNQAAIVARELSSATTVPIDPRALTRVKRTPPLKGLSLHQRNRTVSGAFKVRDPSSIEGRTIVLIDDVLTTGSTANACAKALKRAGAARIELITWARVVRPAQLMQ